MPQSSPGFRRLPAFLGALSCCAATFLCAQSRQRATAAAEVLREPGGLRLGSLVAGAEYGTGRTDRDWVQTTVEGWIFARSTQPTAREGFDLTVSAGGGENLRAAPGGALVARVQEGTLLHRLETQGNWIRVRRTGWVRRTGLRSVAMAANPGRQVGKTQPQTAGRDTLTGRETPAPEAAGRERVSLRKGTELAAAPDGKAVAAMTGPGEAAVVERSRDWVKVSVEGWVRASELAEESGGPRLTAAMIREAPGKYVGQTVSWRLQFLALQKADELRPEIPPGQTYLLARGPLPETGFVYLVLTPDQEEALKRLQPLDEVTIEGVLRAGKSKYLPTPVVELTKIR